MDKGNLGMEFYEFNKGASYYALIGVKKSGGSYVKALKLYYENISDEGFETFGAFHGKSNIVPDVVSKEDTFNKFIHGCADEDITVKKAIENFEKAILEDEVLLLIDGNLL